MNVHHFLREKDVEFETLHHRPTYDARRMAQAVHVPGREVAKTVLLRADGGERYLVACLAADCNIDFEKARQAVGAGSVEMATETEMGQKCPDCELGALPPFGSQYGMQTIVDASLVEDEEIVFEGNTHEEAIRMRYADFVRIESPQVADFAYSAP